MCKYCRYKKCLENGMEASQVRVKPNNIIILSNNTETSNVSIHNFLRSYNSVSHTRKFVVNMVRFVLSQPMLSNPNMNRIRTRSESNFEPILDSEIRSYEYQLAGSSRRFEKFGFEPIRRIPDVKRVRQHCFQQGLTNP